MAMPIPEIHYFVYILRSLAEPSKTYVGFTEQIERRLKEHNAGSQVYSSRYAPWRLETYLAFSSRKLALKFERHLKTPSGKAFANKHLVQAVQGSNLDPRSYEPEEES